LRWAGGSANTSCHDEYDINEYRTKSELTTSKLVSILTAGLRAYDQLKILSTARRGL
jgi:hypothetical protein